MVSPIEEYLSARSDFIAVRGDLHKIRDLLATVACALQSRPERFAFKNSPIGLPMGVVMTRDSVSVDARQWPTAEQIQEQLRKCHEARKKMLDSWNRIPSEHQSAMLPPPEMRY
jgi:hypothetical protein